MTYVKRGGVTAKHINTRIKAASEDDPVISEEGVFTGYASVFGNIDSYGEVVVKGAFKSSLEERELPFSVYWSHQMADPMMNIGKTLEIREDDHGLFVKGQLDLDSPMGAQVYRLIKDGRVNQMSFAFDVEDYKFAETEEDGEFVELHKLKLHEVSIVEVGANQATELLDVKSRVAHIKAGRKVSAANKDKLAQAMSLIEEVLADSDTSDEDDDTSPAEDEEPKAGGKSRTYDPDAALAQLIITTEGA